METIEFETSRNWRCFCDEKISFNEMIKQQGILEAEFNKLEQERDNLCNKILV